MYLDNHTVENPPESLRLFGLCEGLRWTHLPATGGLYAQHPKLLDDWTYIFSRRAEKQRQEEAKKAKKSQQRRPGRF